MSRQLRRQREKQAKKMLGSDPTQALQHAISLHQNGRIQEAIDIYKHVVTAFPKNPDALHLLGLAFHQIGDNNQGLKLIKKALTFQPDNVQYLSNYGTVLTAAGYYEKARGIYQKALQLAPNAAPLFNDFGGVLRALHQEEEALEVFHKAFDLEPKFAMAAYNLGHSYLSIGNLDKAEEFLQKAIEIEPNYFDAYINLGEVAFYKRDYDRQLKLCDRALKINPNAANAYANKARTLKRLDQLDEALDQASKAIDLNPADPSIQKILGGVYIGRKEYGKAITTLEKARTDSPDKERLDVELLLAKTSSCRWDGRQELVKRVAETTDRLINQGYSPEIHPLQHVQTFQNSEHNLKVAKAWSDSIAKCFSDLVLPEKELSESDKDRKITIGYLSNDFRNHAIAHLTQSLFKTHDRSKFNVYGYTSIESDGSTYRQTIEETCDKFIILNKRNYQQAAQTIRDDGVDILIDLAGYTAGSFLDICSLKLAPIQITFLGFPGTTGADFMDYVVVDPVVAPKGDQEFFSEALITMPHCYQVNSLEDLDHSGKAKRKDHNLPDGKFVYGCFCQMDKIEKEAFDSWIDILKKVPNSVLWLWESNKEAGENIKKAFIDSGLSEDRLVFAPSVPKKEHIARMGLCDLALDTFTYNGHTTTSDLMLAGVPVLTLKGNHFASRVSASILNAMDIPDLITETPENYRNRAIQLATEGDELAAIRQKIHNTIKTSPMFDTEKWVKDFESALVKAWVNKIDNNVIEAIKLA